MAAKRLTTAEYWNDVWRADRTEAKQLRPAQAVFGASGTFLKLARATLGDLRGKRVLELGGGGMNYRLLALHTWAQARVTAVDYSSTSLELLRDLFQENHGEVEVVQADFFEWQPSTTYDVVYHCGVLEHFEDPLPLLRLCSSLLADGGKLLVTMPNMQAWGAHFWKAWSPNNWSKHVFHDDDRIAQSCSLAGLELQKSFYYGYPFFRNAPWEKNGLLPFLVSRLQNVASLSGRVFPFYHRVGGMRISMERGFLATRAAEGAGTLLRKSA